MTNHGQTIFNQLNIMVPYVDIIGLCYSVTILWEIYVICDINGCEVAYLLFQANANYGTWSIHSYHYRLPILVRVSKTTLYKVESLHIIAKYYSFCVGGV